MGADRPKQEVVVAAIVVAHGQDVRTFRVFERRPELEVDTELHETDSLRWRQALLDEIAWGADGWPTIGGGRGPSVEAAAPFRVVDRGAATGFDERFGSSRLAPAWVWPQGAAPSVAFVRGALALAPAVGSTGHVPRAVPPANVEGGELDAAIAERFRPLLFFDSSEQLFPLDIEDALATRRVKMCRKAVGDDSCDTVVDPAEIDENLEDAAYRELGSAATYDAAVAAANAAPTGVYSLVQVGSDIFVFSDTNGVAGQDEVIRITGITLDQISASDII